MLAHLLRLCAYLYVDLVQQFMSAMPYRSTTVTARNISLSDNMDIKSFVFIDGGCKGPFISIGTKFMWYTSSGHIRNLF